jgi:GGDEF domain-containing protein
MIDLSESDLHLHLSDLIRPPRKGIGVLFLEVDPIEKADPLSNNDVSKALSNTVARGLSRVLGRGPFMVDRDKCAVIMECASSLLAGQFGEGLRSSFQDVRWNDTRRTISVGVTVSSGTLNENTQLLLARAEEAKNLAKGAGGNCVRLQGPEVNLSTYFEDLSPYTYFSGGEPPNAVNIGWLDAFHPYNKGAVDEIVADHILELCENSVRETRGFHSCPFCTEYDRNVPISVERGGKKVWLGSGEIRVPGRNIIFVCPTLIYHYIQAHHYTPPPEFLDAVSTMQVGGRH